MHVKNVTNIWLRKGMLCMGRIEENEPGNESDGGGILIFLEAGFDEGVRYFLVQLFQYFRERPRDSRTRHLLFFFFSLSLCMYQLRITPTPKCSSSSAQISQFQTRWCHSQIKMPPTHHCQPFKWASLPIWASFYIISSGLDAFSNYLGCC